MPITVVFLQLERFLDFREARAHLVQLLPIVGFRLHQNVLELHLFAPLLLFHFSLALRLVPARVGVKITVDFLLLLARDVMKFELRVPILLICLELVEATSEVQCQLVYRVLVLQRPAEEIDALDAPHGASLRDASDRVWRL